MINFPTLIPDYDSHSPALLDGFISTEASISSTMAFPPLGNSDHVVVVAVFIDFLSNSRDTPFNCTAYDYSPADCVSFHDHLGDVPLEDIFEDSASAVFLSPVSDSSVSGFRFELVYISLIKSMRQ